METAKISLWEVIIGIWILAIVVILGGIFFVPEPLPKNFFRVVSHDYPSLAFQLATLVRDGGSPFFEGRETLHQYLFQDGRYSGSQSPNRENAFSQIREEMGFLP